MINNAILWDLSYGIYVVSSLDNDRPTGCIVNSAFQVTQNSIAISLNHENYTNSIIKQNKNFALSILSEKSDTEIISVFGFCSGKNRNKFDFVQYKMIDNLPIVCDCVGYITLKTTREIELDTHTLFIAEIVGGNVFKNETPMTYKFYHDVIKGSAPKTAPTYIEPNKTETTNEIKYKCKICNYIYNGDITKENDDFVCPVCKQPKSVFEKIN